MSRRWVANASPLILLGKAGRIELLTELTDELIIPEVVAREVRAKPDGDNAIRALESDAGVHFVGERSVPATIERWDLGPGESQVLCVSATDSARAVLDDREARRCAASIEVPVIGTLGVVLRARRKGLIPAARPVLDDLLRAGLYVSSRLIQRALAHLDE